MRDTDRKEAFRPSNIGFGLVALASLVGCGFYHPKGEGTSAFPLSELSFSVVKTEVFQPKCVSCHNGANAGGGIRLETYVEVKPLLDRISAAAIVSQSMPPVGGLSERQKNLLRDWIAAGAPEHGTEPLPSPRPLEPRFASIRNEILEKKCATCHQTGGTAEKIPLLDYASLMDSPRELVLPGNPDESGLVIAVEREDSKQMPPPSSGISPLDEQERRAIREWIIRGASAD